MSAVPGRGRDAYTPRVRPRDCRGTVQTEDGAGTVPVRVVLALDGPIDGAAAQAPHGDVPDFRASRGRDLCGGAGIARVPCSARSAFPPPSSGRRLWR